MKYLDKIVSWFPDCYSTVAKECTLGEFLKDRTHQRTVDLIRSTDDPEARSQMKQTLPCITVSGRFSYRKKEGLIEHTGLLALDFDNIEDIAATKAQICDIRQVLYCGLSASGRGLWAIMPLHYPSQHEGHFKMLRRILSAQGLEIDPACKDITRLRFWSYDDDAYFNPDADAFRLREIEYSTNNVSYNDVLSTPQDTDETFRRLIKWWTDKGFFTKGHRNAAVHTLACSANEHGISKTMVLQYVSQLAEGDFKIDEITKAVDSAYRRTTANIKSTDQW